MRHMHPPQQEVSDRSHTKMLHATGPKRTCGCIESGANFCKVQGTIVVRHQQLLESRDDRRMTNSGLTYVDRSALAETQDHCPHERLLRRPRRLWQGKYAGGALCDFGYCLMEANQSRHHGCRRAYIARDGSLNQIATYKGMAGCGKIISRH